MEKFVLVVIGKTRVGKDSWISSYFDIKTNPGKNDFHSTTYKLETYSKIQNNKEYIILNLPGFDDSRLRFNNQYVIKEIYKTLVEKQLQDINAILILDSLSNDSISVNICYQMLTQLFGQNINRTILVVGTKLDLAEINEDDQENISSFLEICQTLQVQYTSWKCLENSIPISENIKNQLKENLENKLKLLIPYSVSEVERIENQLIQKAQTLMSQTPKKTQIISVEYTEIVNTPYKETLYRNENYIEREIYYETQQVKQIRYVQIQVPQNELRYRTERVCVGTQQRGGLINQITGRRRNVYEDRQVPYYVTVNTTVEQPEEYYTTESVEKEKPVQKTRKVPYLVDRIRTENVKKQRDEIVEIPHQFENFLQKVRSEHLISMRQEIQRLYSS